MYVLVRESVPLGFAMVAVAHAPLAAYLKFRDAPEVAEWLAGPFYKVVCQVTDAEFERARLELTDHVVITESALEGQAVALACKPRSEWPRFVQFLKLYR